MSGEQEWFRKPKLPVPLSLFSHNPSTWLKSSGKAEMRSKLPPPGHSQPINCFQNPKLLIGKKQMKTSQPQVSSITWTGCTLEHPQSRANLNVYLPALFCMTGA